MAKTTKVICLALLFLAIFTQSIRSHETGHPHDHDLEEEHDHDQVQDHDQEQDQDHDHDHDHAQDHAQEDEGEVHGNLLDEGGNEIIASLGLEKKENLNKEEMKNLYEKVFFKKEITENEEKEFYNKIIANVIAGLPEEVKMAEIRNYFDVQYLMKFVEEGISPADGEGEQQDRTKDSL